MAIVSINPVRRDREPSTLEKIAQGLSIANSALNLGLSIPKFIQERKLAQAQEDRAQAQQKQEEDKFGLLKDKTKAEIIKTTRPGLEGATEANADTGEVKVLEPTGTTFSQFPELGRREAVSERGLGDDLKMLQIFKLKNELGPPDENDVALFKKHVGGEPPRTRGETLRMVDSALKKPDSDFEKTFKRKQATSLNDRIDELPTIRERTSNINRALSLLKKVETGPVSGSKYIAALRRVFDKQFQELEQVLNTEGLEQVKAFAKEAGARAIDTEGERAYLNSTIAGVSKDNEVNKSKLLAVKSMLLRGELETRAQQDYVSRSPKKTLDGYQSPLDGKKAYYDPNTLRVEFYREGKQPPGLFSLDKRLLSDPRSEDIGNKGVFR